MTNNLVKFYQKNKAIFDDSQNDFIDISLDRKNRFHIKFSLF